MLFYAEVDFIWYKSFSQKPEMSAHFIHFSRKLSAIKKQPCDNIQQTAALWNFVLTYKRKLSISWYIMFCLDNEICWSNTS